MSKTRRRRNPPPHRALQSSLWRGPWPIVGTLGGLVLLIVIFILISRLETSPGINPGAAADPTVIAEITHVNQSVIDAVGTGGTTNPLTRGSATVLTGANGKPQVLYIGAEWCPYCAAERWAMVVALSHFGTFNGLRFTTSSSADVFPDTRTLSFSGSSYSSSSVDFSPIETADRNRNPLHTPSSSQQQLMQTYDPNGYIPFIDIANQYIVVGQGVSPDPLQGKSWEQIASALSDPNSPITRAIVGNANYLTAAICKLPGTSSAAVCGSSTIKQIATQLP